MNNLKLLSLLSVLYFATVQVSHAQTDKVEVISLSLNAASISAGGFPFDIPFLMKFPVPPNARKILFKYRISDKNVRRKNWIAFPDYNNELQVIKKPDDDKFDGWTLANIPTRIWNYDGQTEFVLKCDGLHPNMAYDFHFTIIKAIAIDSGTKIKMKEAMLHKIQTFYDNSLVDGYTLNNLNKLKTDLETILKNSLGATCDKKIELKKICKNEEDYVIEVNAKSTLGLAFEKAFGVNNALTNSINIRKDYVISLNTNFVNRRIAILSEIDDVLNGNVKLKASTKDALSKPVITVFDEFKMITLRDGLDLLKQIITDPTKLHLMLNGTGKITNNEILPSSTNNPNNIFFLASLIRMLDNGIIRDTVGNNNNHVKFVGLFNNDVTVALNGIANTQADFAKWAEAKNKLINEFPDLSLEIVSSEASIYETISLPDVTTDKTPYISADAGMGYAVPFENGYSYYGANFYFSPVNKKAKLSSFKFPHVLLKMLCLNVSMVNFFGNRPKNSFSFLGDGSSTDIMIGVGVRASRVIKFNFGYLPYKTNQDNPLLDTKITKGAFVVSAGLDVNLLSAISDVAHALKLIK